VLLILLVVFGLPSLFMDEELLYQPQVIAVELDIAPIANAPNRTPTPPKKPEPEKPKPKPPTPKPEPKKPEPKPEPEKKPEPKPEPVKKPEPKPAPKKEEPKKEEVKKEDVKKDEPKKETKKESEKPKEETPKPKKDEKSFEELMKDLDDATPAPAEKGEKIISDVPYDPSAPLSQTVENSIRNQIMACWNYQGGAKDQETLVAHIQVIFREDGSIIDAKLKATDQMRYNSDPAFRSLVDSARRATRNPNCVPLKGLPMNEYKSWSKVELVFDPAEMW
jgi:hypothetical protein